MARSLSHRHATFAAVGAGVALAAWALYKSKRATLRRSRRPSPEMGNSTVPLDTKDGEKLFVYFGSQTGTSEAFASDIANSASDRDLTCEVQDLDEFNEETFVAERCVIIVQSTYGEGDPTDSSLEFLEWLNNAEEGCLKNMRFAVFGCGNRQYTEFNKAAKDVDHHLERLGGTRIVSLGIGDDDTDIEADFSRWLETLWDPLTVALMGREFHLGDIVPKAKVLPLELCIDADAQKLPKDRTVLKEGNDTLAKWIYVSYEVPVSNIRELCQQPDEKRSTVHMDLDISRSRLCYNTGDNAEILPRNPSQVVRRFASILKCEHQLDHFISWTRKSGETQVVKSPFPTPCTLWTALEQYCDLLSLPGKNTLIQFALKLEYPEKIIEFLQSAQFKTMSRAHVSFLAFWDTFFTDLNIDLGTFLQLCPRAKMRPYTISSSSREKKKLIGLTISLVHEELPPRHDIDIPSAKTASVYEGACSSMCCKREPERVRLQIRSSHFQLPAKRSWPIIMIAAGTGVAPFRGFLREFRARDVKPDATMLFFGCQRADTDFIYKEELEEAGELLTNYSLITAFSREQDKKVYVQDRLAEHGDTVRLLLEQGAFVYVCGATKMGRDVEKTLDKILDGSGSALSVDRLRRTKRYVDELWG